MFYAKFNHLPHRRYSILSTITHCTKIMSETLFVNCPQCKIAVAWNKNSPYRPFCSKQCQLIDFGDWADEKNAIEDKSLPDEYGD